MFLCSTYKQHCSANTIILKVYFAIMNSPKHSNSLESKKQKENQKPCFKETL